MRSSSFPDQKAALREEALGRRDALDPVWRARASLAVAERILGVAELWDLEPVSGFWPIRSEIDVRPLLEALHARGQRLCLPVVAKPVMRFHLWKPGDELTRSNFGVREPMPESEEVIPRAMLVPLAAFDRQGGRIGYGRGHFDRAITAIVVQHPVLTIGIGFSVQEVAAVPVEPHDRHLDLIVTEIETIKSARP